MQLKVVNMNKLVKTEQQEVKNNLLRQRHKQLTLKEM